MQHVERVVEIEICWHREARPERGLESFGEPWQQATVIRSIPRARFSILSMHPNEIHENRAYRWS